MTTATDASDMASRSGTPALEFRNVSKSFGGAYALKDVSLMIRPGEVHGLLGENGSGKSTLIKVLAGFHEPESGELEVRGVPVKLPLPAGRFRDLGIEFVHQDLGLVPEMTVVENLRLDKVADPDNRWFMSWREERRHARNLFAEHGLDIDPRAKVSSLEPVERALLAIVRAIEGLRAVGTDRALLVLDEPTAFLSTPDRARLFEFVQRIAAAGGSILLVSHDFDEIRAHTDRVTVLRDGRAVGTVVTQEVSERELVELIIGRTFHRVERRAEVDTRGTVDHNPVVVSDLAGGRVEGVSFTVRHGEVLGLTGQIGAGFEDVPYLLFGAGGRARGTLELPTGRRAIATLSPVHSIRLGMALLTADRQNTGSVPSLPALDNLMLQVLGKYYRGGFLRRRELLKQGRRLFEEFDVRPADPRMTYSSFSGGNQQKALMAKWLQTEPSLLLLHEPTIGVDIGARQKIFGFIRRAADRGAAVICSSNDHEQLADVCDRVLVFSRGRIVDDLADEQLTKDQISQRCFDLASRGASEQASAVDIKGDEYE